MCKKIKASDLSVGDWVCAGVIRFRGEERLTPPMKVTTIGDDWVYLEIDPEQGDPFDEKIEDIRPVPLTEKWLYANGWGDYGHHLRREICNGDKLYASIDVEHDKANEVFWVDVWAHGGYSLKFKCKSVHELQHAMRFVGVEDDLEL